MSTITNTITKKPTIILGGAFNPPTIAHEEMLAVCVSIAKRDNADIWVLPSGERTDKTIGVPVARRLALIDAMVADVPHEGVVVTPHRYELEKTTMTNTYDTVQYFTEMYPERRFIWVFGADSMATMGEWPHGEWLQDSIDKIVFERAGFDVTAFVNERCEVRSVTVLGVSSTLLRQRIAEKSDYRDLVGPQVFALLQDSLPISERLVE